MDKNLEKQLIEDYINKIPLKRIKEKSIALLLILFIKL